MLQNRIDNSETESSWVQKQRIGQENSPFYTTEKQQGAKSIMLFIEFENGDLLAMPYTSLMKIEYTLSSGIRLEWGGEIITIEGHHLKPLFLALVEHKVKSIQEAPEEEPRDPDELFIERIKRD
ncbi:MAG: hypothetical protein KDD63_23905 [Bacteroidetes bacterium]|nr:hypothetical protein [Bacteroidota bacterium]